jgi:aubergine-like protein
MVDKNSSQKFFMERGSEVVNPASGMLVNSEAVGKGFEFYLIAQHCNKGTVKPTYYRVVYSDSTLEEGIIEELLYTQCFNYMNWSGSIKVPSILQYAKKLGEFAGQYLNHDMEGGEMAKYLYYI